MKNEEEFDYLIVPCAGDPKFVGDEIIFSDLEDYKNEKSIKLYLGAKDRMKAAFIKLQDAKKVVLIGGSGSKVTAMFIYFKKRMAELNRKSEKEFICLISKPDSTGNLSAFKKYLENRKLDNTKLSIGIISNEYHLDRLKLIWKDVFKDKKNFELQTFSANNILGNKYIKEKLFKQELERREILEQIGCEDWRKERYKDQEKIMVWTSGFWTCKKLELNFSEDKIE